MNISIIGCGNMAAAILDGLLKNEYTAICVYDIDTEKTAPYATKGVTVADDIASAISGADYVLFALKPNVILQVIAENTEALQGKTVISIAAGISIAAMQHACETAHFIRVMPNTPAQCLAGVSALCHNENTTKEEFDAVVSMFSCVGETVIIEEKFFDAVTALSGSGPAYVFMMIEALSDAGVSCGLPRDVATKLAAGTVSGSAKLLQETGKHPGQLKDMVTSPGGTTIAGIRALEDHGFRAGLIAAVRAAYKRSKQL